MKLEEYNQEIHSDFKCMEINRRGIYFILNDEEEVVYVGQSKVDVFSRITQHTSNRNAPFYGKYKKYIVQVLFMK